jgi:malate synthase
VHNDVELETGERVDRKLVERVAAEEFATIGAELGDPDGHYGEASRLFQRVALDDDFIDFLTLAAYELID